jgi:hypothetical protein
MKHMHTFQQTNEIVALCTAVVGILDVEYGLNPEPSDVSLEMAGFFDGVEHGQVPEVQTIMSNIINDWIGEYDGYDAFKESYSINKPIDAHSVQLSAITKEVAKFNLTSYKQWNIDDIVDEVTLKLGVEVYNDVVFLC